MLRFYIDDTAFVLIDHQTGTNTWASTTPLALLQRNVIVLAKFAKGTGIPVVLTSSQETNVNVQGPLMPELRDTLPEAFAAGAAGGGGRAGRRGGAALRSAAGAAVADRRAAGAADRSGARGSGRRRDRGDA